jgi:hypothetical protein
MIAATVTLGDTVMRELAWGSVLELARIVPAYPSRETDLGCWSAEGGSKVMDICVVVVVRD